MPRVSQAALQALEIVSENQVEVIRRLIAPPELTDEQRAEFRRVVDGMPAEWFAPGNVAMLVQYCRHVVMARHIAQLIEVAMREGDTDNMEALIRAQVRESRVINSLMTSLRLTPQAVEPSRRVSAKMGRGDVTSPWSRKRGAA